MVLYLRTWNPSLSSRNEKVQILNTHCTINPRLFAQRPVCMNVRSMQMPKRPFWRTQRLNNPGSRSKMFVASSLLNLQHPNLYPRRQQSYFVFFPPEVTWFNIKRMCTSAWKLLFMIWFPCGGWSVWPQKLGGKGGEIGSCSLQAFITSYLQTLLTVLTSSNPTRVRTPLRNKHCYHF